MDTSFTNAKEDIAAARQDDTDWAGLTRQQRIRAIELEGFVVLPDLLSAEQISALHGELDSLPLRSTDYSEHQKGCADVWTRNCPVAIDVIANPPIIELLQALFGDDLIWTSVTLGCSEPGHPGIAIHTDSQPYGSKIFGVRASSPTLAIAYRPAWAGPIDDVEDRDAELVAALPEKIQPFFRSLNTRDIEFDLPNRPDNMARDSAGISPQRWGDGSLA